MGWFARLLDETLNVEMDLHRGYCAEFDITTVGVGDHGCQRQPPLPIPHTC